ncbi:MAG: beta-galactosidase [Tannerellaceae bacterium]|nr:beta-galactosidase [Tannerellaceae bacterium]
MMKRIAILISAIAVMSCCLLSCNTRSEKSPESTGEKSGADLPWYQTTYRWAQTNFTEDDPVKADLEFWRQQWRRTKIQGVIVNAGGIVAYYPSELDLQYRAKHLGEQDFFKRVNDMAHEEGIVVVARMDINRATKEFYETHPDWFCRRKNGDPIMSNDRYFSCINSDYYKVFIPQVLEEIIERYHPVGFTDNSWKGLERNTICYCDNCKAKFKAERGMELPEAVSWDDPVYREWVRWGYECRLANWDLFNEVTKKAGGEDCMWFGMVHADPASGSFADLKGILSRSKMIFCDHQGREGAGFEQNSVNGTLLRLASDEQVLAPESMANYVRGGRTFRLGSNPKEETRLWMISGIAGGISPWFHHIGGSQNDSRQFETPVPIFQWHADNEQYLYNRTDLANVGIVWSQPNADFYGRNEVREKVSLPWKGFCQALSRARIPFLPINAQDIGKYASRINTLILPDVAVMSDSEIDAVCDFVSKGGNIILTGNTATLDGDGQPSGNDKLWQLLGLSRTGERKGAFGSTSSSWEVSAAHNYFRLPKDRHEILTGFENTDMLPFGGGLQVVNSTGNLKPAFSYIPPFPIYPPEFSWIREEEPNTYPLFAGTLSGGGRAVYFAGDIDRCYGRALLPDHGKLLSNAVRWASNGTLPLSVEGPGHIDCKVYRQDNRLIVHLTNLTGTNRIGYVDELIPVGPYTVTLDAQGINPGSAFMTVQNTKAPVSIRDGKLTISIDKITDFEMLVIE